MENIIIGHEKEIKKLQYTIDIKNINHSYLFEGKEGIGKKRIAMVFAKTLLCEKEFTYPCGVCSSCIKFDSNNHPDFKLVEAEKNIIRKEQIDEIVDATNSIPFESDYKVFLIDDSHKMNKESMNGILKTLEEPPKFLVIILITYNSKEILPTVRSRCQGIKFYPLKKDEMIEYLKKYKNLNLKDAEIISGFSHGSIGLANKLIDTDKLLDIRERVINIIDSIIEGNSSVAFTSVDFFEEEKDNLNEIFNMFIYWFRDLAIYKETQNIELLINKDKVKLFEKQSHLSFSHINGIIENIEETRRNIESNVNFILSIEIMLLNIQEDN